MQRLTIRNVHVVCVCVYIYVLYVTLCIRFMYNKIYKTESVGEGCFFNIPFQRLIPTSNNITKQGRILV